MFDERLRRELAAVQTGDESLAVGLLDLDGFKEINDTFGHHVGDQVLDRGLEAPRWRPPVPGTLVARLGGDEFAFLFPDRRTRADLEGEARVVLQRIARSLEIDSMGLHVTGSLGIAVAPQDGVDDAELLQRADVAMYSVKARNGSGLAFYDASNDDNSPRRLTTRRRPSARRSPARSSTSCCCPKVRIADGACIGVEALCRWHHAELGPISPDEFIPIAEQTGSIHDLTVLVMRDALRVTSDVAADEGWTVSVNVAIRNLLEDEFVGSIERVLGATGSEPDRLQVEVTETGSLLDTLQVISTLERISALGVSVAVDDFGTGYSSLSYLHQLPVDEVKIDNDFVRTMTHDRRADGIVRSIIDLGRNLGIRVVAEGVETEAMWTHLRELGCDLAQGYYVARPMDAGELAAWADRWRSRRHDGIGSHADTAVPR